MAARPVLYRPHLVEEQERIGMAQGLAWERAAHDKAAALALAMRGDDFRDLMRIADFCSHRILHDWLRRLACCGPHDSGGNGGQSGPCRCLALLRPEGETFAPDNLDIIDAMKARSHRSWKSFASKGIPGA